MARTVHELCNADIEMPEKWWEESIFFRVQKNLVPWTSWERQPARTGQ